MPEPVAGAEAPGDAHEVNGEAGSDQGPRCEGEGKTCP
jgi:hypothetical protein